MQAEVNTAARIDWRKLLMPSLFIMVLPTIAALLLDKSLGTLPYITIVAIVICFPTATFWVIRIALQEMDRVIAEVTPQQSLEPSLAQSLAQSPADQDESAPDSAPDSVLGTAPEANILVAAETVEDTGTHSSSSP